MLREFCRGFFPIIHKAFQDPRMNEAARSFCAAPSTCQTVTSLAVDDPSRSLQDGAE